jgi:hypothetical protein
MLGFGMASTGAGGTGYFFGTAAGGGPHGRPHLAIREAQVIERTLRAVLCHIENNTRVDALGRLQTGGNGEIVRESRPVGGRGHLQCARVCDDRAVDADDFKAYLQACVATVIAGECHTLSGAHGHSAQGGQRVADQRISADARRPSGPVVG